MGQLTAIRTGLHALDVRSPVVFVPDKDLRRVEPDGQADSARW
jgi:hypothetical protein